MTATREPSVTADAAPEVRLFDIDPAEGCVGCGAQFTVQLHPYRGRLCPRHAVLPTIPPGPYRRDLALDMVDLGRADAARAYLGAYLHREADARFTAVTARLAVAA